MEEADEDFVSYDNEESAFNSAYSAFTSTNQVMTTVVAAAVDGKPVPSATSNSNSISPVVLVGTSDDDDPPEILEISTEERSKSFPKPPDSILKMGPFASNQHCREKAKPYAKRMYNIFNDENHINHSPIGDFVDVFYYSEDDFPDGRNRYIYWKDDKGIGFTGKLSERIINYWKKERVYPKIIVIARIDTDASMKMDEDSKLVVQEFLDDFIQDVKVPFYLSEFLIAIRDRGGAEKGLIGQVVCQLLETGCAVQFNVPRMMEFLVCDEFIIQERHRIVGRAAKEILARLPKKRYKKVVMMASWKTGFEDSENSNNQLITKPCMNDNLVGRDCWENALDFAAIPNSKTRTEAFDTSKYTSIQKLGGRENVHRFIEECCQYGDFCILDANEDPLFPTDKISKLLVSRYNFTLEYSVFGNELRLYIDKNGGAILLNKPFEVAGDAYITLH